MRLKSVYTFNCVCGHTIESETKEAVCPSCHRQIVIVWPGEWEEPERETKVCPIRKAATA